MRKRALRIVTYNIHKGIGGLDRRYRPERIIEALAGLHADLLFLQEVDDNVPRSRRHRQVDFLGDALGFRHRVYYPNVRLRRGRYGNALLSRFSFDHKQNIDLTVRMRKPRGALHARTNINVGRRSVRLWIFNVHLGLAEYERRRQLKHLVGWQYHHRKPAGTATILGGDLNDVWGRLGPRILEPAGYQGTPRRICTFPAVRPVRSLDRIFVNGPLTITRAYGARTKVTRQASDHLPLVVEIAMK